LRLGMRKNFRSFMITLWILLSIVNLRIVIHAWIFFFKEVYRILRPGALLLYTDFGFDHEMAGIRNLLDESGLTLANEMIITDNVVKALQADDHRRRTLVKRLTPGFLHKQAFNFAGNIGGEPIICLHQTNIITFSTCYKRNKLSSISFTELRPTLFSDSLIMFVMIRI
jgi:SAM-dependent methyltransferase